MRFLSLAPPPTAPALSRTTAPSPPPSNKLLSPPPASAAPTDRTTTTTVASPPMVSPPPPTSGYPLPSWLSWPVLLPSSCKKGKHANSFLFLFFSFTVQTSRMAVGSWVLFLEESCTKRRCCLEKLIPFEKNPFSASMSRSWKRNLSYVSSLGVGVER